FNPSQYDPDEPSHEFGGFLVSEIIERGFSELEIGSMEKICAPGCQNFLPFALKMHPLSNLSHAAREYQVIGIVWLPAFIEECRIHRHTIRPREFAQPNSPCQMLYRRIH